MTSVKKTLLLLVVFGFWPLKAVAYDLERAVLNLSADFSECAAYSAIVSHLPESDSEVARVYGNASVQLLQLAIETSNEKAATARMQTAIKSMFAELGGELGNMSILINQYSDFCQKLFNNSESRLQYWLDKKD